MGRFRSWLLSAVIHGALLVGATLPLMDRSGDAEGGDDGGMVCRFIEAPWRFDRVDHAPDVFGHERPELPRAMTEDERFKVWSGASIDRRGCGPCEEEFRTGSLCRVCTLWDMMIHKDPIYAPDPFLGRAVLPPPCSCGKCGSMTQVLKLLRE
ncbi:MAG TPA: hypothetical protein VNM14_05195 [Planctomycetota bacterium]|jgi:hypothetical protein|nr:hypothetical protein [Planctomycetota bacterium]